MRYLLAILLILTFTTLLISCGNKKESDPRITTYLSIPISYINSSHDAFYVSETEEEKLKSLRVIKNYSCEFKFKGNNEKGDIALMGMLYSSNKSPHLQKSFVKTEYLENIKRGDLSYLDLMASPIMENSSTRKVKSLRINPIESNGRKFRGYPLVGKNFTYSLTDAGKAIIMTYSISHSENPSVADHIFIQLECIPDSTNPHKVFEL